MTEDLGLRPLADGRVGHHRAADGPPRPHRHAELELNLVVRGSASYLLGDRRYELTPRTLTWLFPGQDHVLVDESADHELWWAVFRPGLVSRAAPTKLVWPLVERDPVGEFSRRLEVRSAGRLEALLRELHDVETVDDALHNAGLAYLLLSAWRAFLESEDLVMQELVAREAGLATAGGVAATRAPPGPVLDPAGVLFVPRPALAWVPGIGLKEVGRHAAREAERDVIQQVLEEVRWNRMEAARRLKISYKALLYKIRMYDLGTSPPGKSAA